MIELIAIAAAAQVGTIHLPPAPSAQVEAVRLKPDLVVKEIRIQNDRTMHVLVANIGTGGVAEPFPVRASVERSGTSYDLKPSYSAPLAAGAEAWVTIDGTGYELTKASSATAGADLLPPPAEAKSYWALWPSIFSGSSWSSLFPAGKEPCKKVDGCVVELDETNNSYAIAGVPRGTPERLDAAGPAPETVPASPPERG